MRPGRICAIHCKDLVYYRTQRSTAGLRDFPGDLIRAHISAGFDFHSRDDLALPSAPDDKNLNHTASPTAGLHADYSFSRQGLPEYYLLFRIWGKKAARLEPVTRAKTDFPLPNGRNRRRQSGCARGKPMCFLRSAIRETKNTSAQCPSISSSGPLHFGRTKMTWCLIRLPASAQLASLRLALAAKRSR